MAAEPIANGASTGAGKSMSRTVLYNAYEEAFTQTSCQEYAARSEAAVENAGTLDEGSPVSPAMHISGQGTAHA